MAKKISYNLTCPYCDERCNRNTDEFTVTKRKTKQYFHRACYEANTIKNR